MRSYRYWSVGVTVGAMHYQGDLDDHGFQPWISARGDNSKYNFMSTLRLFRPSFGASAMYHFHPHMNLQLGACYGWIGAADSNAYDGGANRYRIFRNLDFRNRIFEASAILNYEFFATDRHYRFRPKFTPYVFAGVAAFYHNPFTYIRKYEMDFYGSAAGGNYNMTSYDGQRIYLQPLRTEGQGSGCTNCGDAYSLVQVSIPFGIGFRWRLSDRLDLRLHVGIRKTFTDHLDDVGSYYYADPNGYLEGRLDTENQVLSYILSDRSKYRFIWSGRNNSGYQVQQNDLRRGRQINEDQGEKRGFPNQDDWYAYTGFIVSYVLDPGDRCPKFR